MTTAKLYINDEEYEVKLSLNKDNVYENEERNSKADNISIVAEELATKLKYQNSWGSLDISNMSNLISLNLDQFYSILDTALTGKDQTTTINGSLEEDKIVLVLNCTFSNVALTLPLVFTLNLHSVEGDNIERLNGAIVALNKRIKVVEINNPDPDTKLTNDITTLKENQTNNSNEINVLSRNVNLIACEIESIKYGNLKANKEFALLNDKIKKISGDINTVLNEKISIINAKNDNDINTLEEKKENDVKHNNALCMLNDINTVLNEKISLINSEIVPLKEVNNVLRENNTRIVDDLIILREKVDMLNGEINTLKENETRSSVIIQELVTYIQRIKALEAKTNNIVNVSIFKDDVRREYVAGQDTIAINVEKKVAESKLFVQFNLCVHGECNAETCPIITYNGTTTFGQSDGYSNNSGYGRSLMCYAYIENHTTVGVQTLTMKFNPTMVPFKVINPNVTDYAYYEGTQTCSIIRVEELL